jgi:hypothetical protein
MSNGSKVVAALCLLGVGVAASSAAKVASATPAPGYLVPVPANPVQAHPRIRAAIDALDAAKAELKAAPHDFDGHRVDALKAIDAALAQLNICMKVK